MSGYTSLPSRPGTLPAWPTSTPLDSSGHLIYYKQAGQGYEAYEVPVSRLNGAKSGTAVSDVLQVETATVDSTGDTGATGSATTNVTITSVLFAAPVVVGVALTSADNTNDKVATKVRAALAANALVAAAFTVSGATDKVILTAKVAAANDDTLNIAIAAGNGILAAASSANTTAGVYGTRPDFLGQMSINGTTVQVCTSTATNSVTWTQVN